MSQKRKPSITASFSYLPLEETLEIIPKKEQLYIGIPREDIFQENRIALTPSAVSVLINNGHKVLVEHKAGEKSFYFDTDYSEAGATICYNKEELYRANIIIKASPISDEEIAFLQPMQIIIAPMHMPALTMDRIQKLQNKKVIAIDSGGIKDEAGYYPIVRSMSEIAGIFAINTAAQLLTNNAAGKGVLLGGVSGVPPCQILILGAGVVGENAARTALGLGAQVKIFDNNIYKLIRVKRNLGQHVSTSVLDPVLLGDDLMTTDVLVGALKPHKGQTPIVVNEEMVANMKAGSVIIDVSIDCGGCVETSEATTHEKPTFKKYDVIHYCVPNIPSAVSRTASQCLSNIIMPMMLEASKNGGLETLIRNQIGFRNAVYIYNGFITNEHLANKLAMKYTSLELLIMSNQ
jgi:alanine dehydrogenase